MPGPRTLAHRGRDRVAIVPVPLGAYPPWREAESPGGDEEWPVRAGQRLAERLDGAAIRTGSLLEAARERDVVLVREVHHAVRRGGCLAQAVEVIERTAMHLGPGRGEDSGRGIRAGKPGDLMARAEELGYDSGADPAGRAGDEYMHGRNLQVGADGPGRSAGARTHRCQSLSLA